MAPAELVGAGRPFNGELPFASLGGGGVGAGEVLLDAVAFAGHNVSHGDGLDGKMAMVAGEEVGMGEGVQLQ